ncbi:MAG: 6,7-dimethyl-8-ribityllumazine synthase [archaeon]
MKLGMVVSEFHYDITSLMEQRALEHAKFLGATVFETIKVPGCYDMPLAVKKLLEEKDIEGVVTIGTVIKGATSHDEVVASQTARKLMDLSIDYNKPVSLGISGPNISRPQAQERVNEYAERAVESVVKMIKRGK